MSNEDPRVREILAKRTTVISGKPVFRGESRGVVEAVKSVAEVKVPTDSHTRAQVELESVENKMVLDRVNEISKSLVGVEEELQTLSKIFKVVLCVGVAGVILVAGAVLRLTGYL
jgi:hypothetical protein